LPALQDRFNQLWAQEGETNEPADVAPGDAVTFGQRLQRQRVSLLGILSVLLAPAPLKPLSSRANS
jgi:hypothetical protein